MTNPFENENGFYLVLRNEEGQCSLWPSFVDVPDGWSVSYGPDTRAACLVHVESTWTDMRPHSLIVEMEKSNTGQVAT
jgi:MbtH protein